MPPKDPSNSWPKPNSKKSEKDEEFLMPEAAHFNQEKNTLILELHKKNFDLSKLNILATEEGLKEKPEFHVTIISFRNGVSIKKVLEQLSEQECKILLKKITDLVEQTKWSFKKTNDFLRLKREYSISGPPPDYEPTGEFETRESYVAMLQSEVVRDFYTKLESLLNISFTEIPPPHTTLFTKSTLEEKANMGIAINSPEDPSLKEAKKIEFK